MSTFDDDTDIDTETDDDATDAPTDSPADESHVHRGILAGVIGELQDSGVDIDALAERAGIPSSDVASLSDDDLAGLARYVGAHHPEVLQSVASRFPGATDLLTENGEKSGLLSGILGQYL